MFKKKIIAIITTHSNYQHIININSLLYDEILKEFKELYIINLQNLILFNKKKINKKTKFKLKNIKIFTPKNSTELKKFFEKKKLVALNNLGKNFLNFKIHYILNKINLTQILVMNIGFLSNTSKVRASSTKETFISFLFFFNKKITMYFFKFFTIINIFPKIDYYFDSSKLTIKNMNSSFIRKIEKIFPQIRISYYKKAININSRGFDQLLIKKITKEEKYLVFIDSFNEHSDRTSREGPVSTEDSLKYYSTLSNFMKKLSKFYNKKFIICIHPKNNSKLFIKHFKNFTIKKYKTQEMIAKSFISFFHSSSSVLDSIILNKHTILLKSNLLGSFVSDRVVQYQRLLNLQSLNIDDYPLLKKNKVDLIFNSPKKNNYYIKNHLNSDGLIPGYKKIIRLLKKIT